MPAEISHVVLEKLLSCREQEIAELLVRGQSYQEIADGLAICLETVRWHVKRIYPKMGVRSRGELAWRVMGR